MTTLTSMERLTITVLALPCLLACLTAHALEFTIDSNDDAVDAAPGDGICASVLADMPCTLRAAIQEANAFPGFDALLVPAGPYFLRIAGADENMAATGDLDIREPLSMTMRSTLGIGSSTRIDIAAHPASSIGYDDRLIDIDTGQIDVAVRFADASFNFGNPSSAAIDGSAILIRTGSALALHRTLFYANGESPRGGDIANYGRLHARELFSSDMQIGSPPAPGHGGSLYLGSGSQTDIADCQFDTRTARGAGGAIYALGATTRLTLRRCHLANLSDMRIDGIALVGPVHAHIENVEFDSESTIDADRTALSVGDGAQASMHHVSVLAGRITVSDGISEVRLGNSVLGDVARWLHPDDGSGADDCVAPPGGLLSEGGNLVQPGNPCFLKQHPDDVVALHFELESVDMPNPWIPQFRRQFFRPTTDSPALDTARTVNCLSHDAIGTSRPQTPVLGMSPRCDIGAIETPGDILFLGSFEA